MVVDCRRCKYFIPRSEMSSEQLREAWIYVTENFPDRHVLGWCKKRGKPITYYTGKCRFYLPKPSLKQKTLTGEVIEW